MSDDPLTTVRYLWITKQVGLTLEDLDSMLLYQVVDYIEEHVSHQPGSKKKPKVRKATQADIDRL